MDLEQARLQSLVQFFLEQVNRLVTDAALYPFVDEVLRPVEDHAGANQAALHHRVEVVGVGLVEKVSCFLRQRVVR